MLQIGVVELCENYKEIRIPVEDKSMDNNAEVTEIGENIGKIKSNHTRYVQY